MTIKTIYITKEHIGKNVYAWMHGLRNIFPIYQQLGDAMQIKMKGRDGVDGKDGPCVSAFRIY